MVKTGAAKQEDGRTPGKRSSQGRHDDTGQSRSSEDQASPEQTQTSSAATWITWQDFQIVILSAVGTYAIWRICSVIYNFICQYIQEALEHFRSHHNRLWQLVPSNAFEMLCMTYSLAPVPIRYAIHTPLGRRLSLKIHQSLRSASQFFAASTIIPPLLQEIRDHLAAMSSRAARWYTALAHKALLHERMMKAMSAQISVMVAWCARSFETLTEQIRELDQRVKQQEATLVVERARIRQLYAAIEPIKNGYLSSQSVWERMQPDVSTVSGGLVNVQGAIDRLALRFDTFERRAATSDNRIEALELQIKVLRSSLESLRRHCNEAQRSEAPTTAPVTAPPPVYAHRAVQCTLVQEPLVKAEVSQELERLLEQQRPLDKKLDEQKRQLHDQITSLEKRMAAEQASLKNREDAMRSKLDALAASSAASQVLVEAKAIVQEKYMTIVAECKKKFAGQDARFAALEQDVYKSKTSLPVGERLDVLEYDVQKLVGTEKESAVELRNAIEKLNVLQDRVDNLRHDMKNALKKVSTPAADPKQNEVRDSAVQQLTARLEVLEHDSIGHLDKMDHFQQRFEQVQRDCRQFLEKTQQLTGSEGLRLDDLKRVLERATEIFSIGLVQIKQQVETLEDELTGVGNEVGGYVAELLDHALAEEDEGAPSAPPSNCNYSIEAVRDHSVPTNTIPEEHSPFSNPIHQAEASVLSVGDADVQEHHLVREGTLAPSNYDALAHTRDFVFEQVQQAITGLNDRCRIMESKLETLSVVSDGGMIASREGHMMGQMIAHGECLKLDEKDVSVGMGRTTVATSRSTEPGWLQEAAIVRSADAAPLPTGSSSRVSPFDHPTSLNQANASNSPEAEEERGSVGAMPRILTSAPSGPGQNVQTLDQRGLSPPSASSYDRVQFQESAATSDQSFASPPFPGEVGRATALESKVEHLERYIHRQVSLFQASLDKTMASLRDLTVMMVSSSGLAMSSEQQTTVVEILGSRFEDTTLQSSASDGGPVATLQATLAEISVACATLKNNFQHMDSIVDQNTAEIASLQSLLDDLSQRQNAAPPLWRVNRLGQDIRELTDRMNRLEQNLRFKRLI